jgi:hypothetical protein
MELDYGMEEWKSGRRAHCVANQWMVSDIGRVSRERAAWSVRSRWWCHYLVAKVALDGGLSSRSFVSALAALKRGILFVLSWHLFWRKMGQGQRICHVAIRNEHVHCQH